MATIYATLGGMVGEEKQLPGGRPLSLGMDVDLADAEALLAVLRVVKDVLGRHSDTGVRHLANEALWDIWEKRRLPRPLVASKYPKSYPWSPNARAMYAKNDGRRPPGGWGLVMEHLTPRGVLLGSLIEESSILDPASLASQLHGRLACAVITRSDDANLTRAGLRIQLVDGADGTADGSVDI